MDKVKTYCDKCVYGDGIMDRCRKHNYAGDSIGRKDTINANGDCEHYEPKPWEKVKREWSQMWTGLLSRRVKNQSRDKKS